MREEVNRRIVEALDRAEIPIVLLDRDICVYPLRSRYDLIGIDNRRAGYVITDHLLSLGRRRIVFVMRPYCNPTVDARVWGYREALFSRGITVDPEFLLQGDPNDRTFVQGVLERIHPEAFVCANDITAARMMRTLNELGVKIPSDVGVVGIDDVKYASLLHVPLTTIHQPCRDLGVAALVAMLERIRHPEMPARDIFVDFKLIIRQSCGATLQTEKNSRACVPPATCLGGDEQVNEAGEAVRAR